MARSGLILPSSNRQPPRLTRGGVSSKPSRRLEAVGAPRKHRHPRHSVTLAREEPATRKRWLIGLILFSLLVHALIVVAIVLISRHGPQWKPPVQDEKPPEVNLVLAPPPPPATRRPDFIPTEPQQNAPHRNSPFISDNDARLQSQNRTARSPDSALPDVTGRHDHSLDLHSQAPSPLIKSNPSPPAPQEPKQPPHKQKSQTKPNKETKPAPPDPNAIDPTDNPEKGHEVSKEKPSDQQYDPNGLPVLPAIDAPALQPQTPQTEVVPQTRQAAPPRSVPSFAVYQSDVSGQAGAPGSNSPAAMATDLGRYKAKVYRAVGARWYSKVNNQLQVLGVGTVHITYTIYADGTLRITADPDADNPALMLLHSISVLSMTEAAPFDHFSDAMRKQVGDSYTDDFSFSIYGN